VPFRAEYTAFGVQTMSMGTGRTGCQRTILNLGASCARNKGDATPLPANDNAFPIPIPKHGDPHGECTATVGDCFATSYIPNHICMDLVAVSRRRGNLARTGLQGKQVRIVNSEYVQEELASVLKEFTKRDYAWLSSSLERVREGLLDRCQTAGERGFVWLAFHLHAIALADLKGVPLERTVSMVDAAFAHIAADPAHLVVAVAGYAGRCRAEGRTELGRDHLRKAIAYMDSGPYWARLAPDAEPAIKGQLKAMGG
jgi:hypothetical protein